MSSTPATQENPPDQEKRGVKTKCPHVLENPILEFGFSRSYVRCGKTILIDDKVRCSRCNNETSIAQLQAMRLLNGETTHAQFMRELEKQLPLDQDPPAHDRAREIMGENFISRIEAIRAFNLISNGRSHFGEYLELLSIPFSDELLKSVAQTHVLIPIIQTQLKYQPYFKLASLINFNLCYCHKQWRSCSIANEGTKSGRWVLIQKNPREELFSARDWFENGEMKFMNIRRDADYVPTAGELVYLDQILQRTRDKGLISTTGINVWCRPISGMPDIYTTEHEYPMLAKCRNNRMALTIAPNSFKGNGLLITAKNPDLEI